MSRRISTVAEETGVAAMTLRAWERRYGFPKPERTDKNYRSYGDAEVARLRRVVALMAHGLTVSEAIARIQSEGTPAGVVPKDLIERFFAAANALDQAGIDDVLRAARRDLPPERACDEVLLPILRDMSDRLDIAREHFASRSVRNALAQLASVGKRASKHGPIVLACPAGEEHEGGLLAIAVHLKLRGERVVLLGANTPTDALSTACQQLKPSALCLSLIQRRKPQAVLTLVSDIVKRCRAPLVIVGGAVARDNLKHVFAAGAEYAKDAEEVLKKVAEKRVEVEKEKRR